jgi:hypothetical protein
MLTDLLNVFNPYLSAGLSQYNPPVQAFVLEPAIAPFLFNI